MVAGNRSISFLDPDGNRVEIACNANKFQFDSRQRKAKDRRGVKTLAAFSDGFIPLSQERSASADKLTFRTARLFRMTYSVECHSERKRRI